jgi:branched-chain amino acid transport system permease protein
MLGQVAGQLTSQSITTGSIYALVGVGFVILFRATGVVNFAQGEFMVLGAYFFYGFKVELHQNSLVAIFAALIAMIALGIVVNMVIFYRLVGASLFTVVIATFGLSILLETAGLIVWGPDTRELPNIFSNNTLVSPLGIPLTTLDIVTIVVAIVLIVLLEIILRTTRTGVRMRAVADSTLLAALQRVHIPRFAGLAWAIASVCSAIAGVALALQSAVDPVNIGQLGLLIFPVVIIGGVDSIIGALVGGLIVATIQTLVAYYLNGIWVDPICYGMLLAFLLFRPRGIFGTREIVRV